MRIFTSKVFNRFARKAALDDRALREAINNAEQGLIDADLGGGVIKQRIARPGGGKSGGFRTIILFRTAERAVFIYGFRRLATVMLAYSNCELATAIESGALIEVTNAQAIP